MAHTNAPLVNCACAYASTRWLTTDELETRLGFPKERIIKLAKKGELQGDYDEDEDTWWFLPEEAEEYNKRMREALSQKKQQDQRESTSSKQKVTEVPESAKSVPTEKVADVSQSTTPVSTGVAVEVSQSTTPVSTENFAEVSQSTTPVPTENPSTLQDTTTKLKHTAVDQEKSHISNFDSSEIAIAQAAIAKEAESQRLYYVLKAKERIDEFSMLNTQEKGKLTQKYLKDLKSGLPKGSIPDYVELYKLGVKKRGNKYYLSFRNKSDEHKAIASIFDSEGTRLSLETECLEEAKEKANQKIHEASLKSPKPLKETKGRYLGNALAQAHTQTSSSTASTADAKIKKLGVWHYIAGDLPLEYFDVSFVNMVIQEMHENEWSDSTKHQYGVELRAASKIAYELKWISHQPTIPSFKSGEREFIDLPYSTWQRFVNHYAKTMQEKMFLMLLWHMGIRYTSLLEADVSQFDLNKKIMHLPALKNKARVMVEVPLSDEAIQCITSLLKYRKENSISSSKLFADKKGKLPRLNYLRWRAAIKAANLPESFVPHHVRHYFATDLRRNGATLETIAKAGGWTSTESVKRYCHIGVTVTELQAVNSRT